MQVIDSSASDAVTPDAAPVICDSAPPKRLEQTKGAGKVFVLFEAVAAARMVTIHSHTTLGGELTGEQLRPRVLDLGEDDPNEIPF